MGRPRSKEAPDARSRPRLIQARKAKDLSQHKLAELLGTTYVNISRWERGITRPSLYFRKKLTNILGKNEADLDLIPKPEESTNLTVPEIQDTLTPPVSASTLHPSTYASATEHQKSLDSDTYLSHLVVEEKILATSTNSAANVLISTDPIIDPLIPLKPEKPLVGRETELAQVKTRLRAGGNVALTALNGLPGVGKTALSIAIANDKEMRERFRDGVLWAALGPSADLDGILSRWAVLLGVPETTFADKSKATSRAQALRSAIGLRSMLIVIDDAWKPEHAHLLCIGGDNCAHLVTTRFTSIAIGVTNEGTITLQELNDEQSIKLLSQLTPSVVERERQRAQELVHAVGGLPLALTLAGNFLNKQAHGGNMRRIRAAFDRLRDASERLNMSITNQRVESHSSLTENEHISLETLFAVTDLQLNEIERATLYALSVFPPKPGDFSEEAACVVGHCHTDVLDRLTDTGLLENKGHDRYTLHQTIADYTHLKLVQSGSKALQRAEEKLINYALHIIDEHRKDYETLEREQGVLLHALDLASTPTRAPQLIEGATGFAPFLLLRALYDTAATYLERAHALAIEANDRRGISSTHLYLGELALRQNSYDEANTHLLTGLKLARQLNDRELVCDLLINLGGIAWKRGEYSQAQNYFEQGLTIAREIGDIERTCSLLKALALIFASEGNNVKEREYLLEGVKLAERVESDEQLCVMLMNLGVSVAEQGNYDAAETYFQRGLNIAKRIGHKEWISALLSNLGDIAIMQKQYALAEDFFREGLTTAKQIRNREWLSMILLNLGVITRKQERYDEAKQYLEESLGLAEEIKIPYIICNVLYESGLLSLRQKNIGYAEESFDRMYGLIPEGDRELQALAEYGLAQVAMHQQKVERARNLAESSLKKLRELGNRKAEEVKTWMTKASLCMSF